MPVLAERMLLPVDVIVQPVSESTLEPAVFFQASVINHDLPPGTTGIRTGIRDAGEGIIIGRKSNLHKIINSFVLGKI